MGTDWAAINETINEHLSAGRPAEAAACARSVVSAHIGQPGSEAPLIDLLRNITRSRDLHFIDLIGIVANGAPGGSRLQEAAAGCLLSLSMAFNKAAANRAAQTVWMAAQRLPPDSPAGEAAIDRLIDLAQRDIDNDDMAAVFLRLAAGRAVPRSPLAEKGRDFWMKKLDRLSAGHRIQEIKEAIKYAPGEADIYSAAVSLWGETVKGMIDEGKTDAAFDLAKAIITDPSSHIPAQKEATKLWARIIDHWRQAVPNRSVLKACNTSDEIYKNARGPEQLSYAKEGVAWKLLDLAGLTANRGLSQQMVLRAADYDGGNLSLRRRLVENLQDVIAYGVKKEHRIAAREKLRIHAGYINGRNPGGRNGPPPEFDL